MKETRANQDSNQNSPKIQVNSLEDLLAKTSKIYDLLVKKGELIEGFEEIKKFFPIPIEGKVRSLKNSELQKIKEKLDELVAYFGDFVETKNNEELFGIKISEIIYGYYLFYVCGEDLRGYLNFIRDEESDEEIMFGFDVFYSGFIYYFQGYNCTTFLTEGASIDSVSQIEEQFFTLFFKKEDKLLEFVPKFYQAFESIKNKKASRDKMNFFHILGSVYENFPKPISKLEIAARVGLFALSSGLVVFATLCVLDIVFGTKILGFAGLVSLAVVVKGSTAASVVAGIEIAAASSVGTLGVITALVPYAVRKGFAKIAEKTKEVFAGIRNWFNHLFEKEDADIKKPPKPKLAKTCCLPGMTMGWIMHDLKEAANAAKNALEGKILGAKKKSNVNTAETRAGHSDSVFVNVPLNDEVPKNNEGRDASKTRTLSLTSSDSSSSEEEDFQESSPKAISVAVHWNALVGPDDSGNYEQTDGNTFTQH